MKIKSLVYWATTLATAGSMAAAAILYLTRNRKTLGLFQELGYPDYFPTILGTFKLLGAAALVAPGRRVLKEWAYAGFAFTFLGAWGSEAAKHKKAETIPPLISLVILLASYLSRPASHRLPEGPHL